jgi:hypothetical protein
MNYPIIIDDKWVTEHLEIKIYPITLSGVVLRDSLRACADMVLGDVRRISGTMFCAHGTDFYSTKNAPTSKEK